MACTSYVQAEIYTVTHLIDSIKRLFQLVSLLSFPHLNGAVQLMGSCHTPPSPHTRTEDVEDLNLVIQDQTRHAASWNLKREKVRIQSCYRLMMLKSHILTHPMLRCNMSIGGTFLKT